MMDKLDKMDVQKRVLLATVISLLFFIPYSFFLAPESSNTPTEQTQQQATDTPSSQNDLDAPMGQNESPQNDADSMAAPQAKQTVEAAENAMADEILARIVAEHFELIIDNKGRIAQAYLKDDKFQEIGEEKLPLFSYQTLPKPLEIRFADKELNKKAFEGSYSVDKPEVVLNGQPQTIVLTKPMGNFTITKTITFEPSGHYQFSITTDKNSRFFISPGYRPEVALDEFTFAGAIIEEMDTTITKIEDGDTVGNEYFRNARIAAVVDRYYASLIYDFDNQMNVAISAERGTSNPLVFVEGIGSFSAKGYIGPKDYKLIRSIDPNLTSIVEYGFITFFAKPLFIAMIWIYDHVGNWGWAIVILTFLVRLVLYPLTYKGMVSLARLKEIAPKMKEIQQKYKGDPQKMQVHMMELYRKHGANPMGGCLPLILQMPIFFAIYRVLYNAIELKSADWILWITDLSVMDPYFVLPILMGGSMYLQQVMTPNTFTDPMQEKIFKYLPVVFTFFFLTFPAGLVLYWFVNNLFSIGQQYIINRSLEAKKAAREAAKEKDHS